jgi:hypothetical protein
MSLRDAAVHALGVLEVIRDFDADSGISDPDVLEAIERLTCEVGSKRAEKQASQRPNRWGYTLGQPLRVIGGRLTGASVTFAGVSSTHQLRVMHAGEALCLQAAHVEAA